MTQAALNNAFNTPRPHVALDGDVDPALAQGLLSMVINEDTEGLYCCEATFGNWGTTDGTAGFLYFDRNVFNFGRRLSIDVGDENSPMEIFNGRITALEGRFPQQSPAELLILAEDNLQDLRMVRRSRSFDNNSVSDIISTIANEHGLDAEVDVSGPQYPVLTQVNQSDLAFIRQCARDVDAEIWIQDGVLHAQQRTRRRRDEVTLTFGQALFEFSVTADLAQQRTSLVVNGWDVERKEAISHSADSSILQNELNGGSSGGQLLNDVFGERKDSVVHQISSSAIEAQHAAEAGYRRIARRFLTGQGIAEGNGLIRAGTHLQLEDLGPLFSGSYYVTEVTHIFDQEKGYRTFFQVERPGLGAN
ncbi:MAG: contractile injection system protein, VgrG/Pvc8 family [Gammaproteobacteria bacterium]|nr:contractile injection system protein, VgrG/Pvc8 family [Gammaproteobacteria bacterium]